MHKEQMVTIKFKGCHWQISNSSLNMRRRMKTVPATLNRNTLSESNVRVLQASGTRVRV
jgi:coenzyme F420-reducing hydrogenase delta subunit